MTPEGARLRGGRARILYALLSVISITALVPLLVEAWKLIDINREALETSQREYQLQLARSMAQRVDAYVDQALSQVRTMGEGFALAARLSGDSTLMRYLQKQSGLNGALDSSLLELRYYPAGGRRSVRSRRALPGGDPVIDDLFKLARKEVLRGSEFTGAPIHLPSLGEPILVVGVPVRSRGRQMGALVALTSLSGVWDAMVRDVVFGHAVYALNRSGDLFAHSDPRGLSRGSTVKESELVQRFISSGGMLGETLPFTVGTGEAARHFLGAYMPTHRRWGLFVQAEEKLAYHTVREMIDSTLKWAAITLVIALAAAFFFARQISEPIKRLAQHARSLAAGDFSARVELNSRNEIGQLAETFNLMSHELERYIEQLKQAAHENNLLFLGTIRTLAAAIDEKDPYTRGHSERVNKYAVVLARRLGMTKKQVRDIHVSSLLHDIGKIGVDDAILRKPGALTPEEFTEMKKHPEKGANIMAPIPQMQNIIPGIHFHHEKWGGGGYPKGLKGDEIPFMARVIQVADSFDAMTTNRPYQQSMSYEAAVARIHELTGPVFNPKIVEAFTQAYRKGELGLPEKQLGLDPQPNPAAGTGLAPAPDSDDKAPQPEAPTPADPVNR